MQMTKMFRKQVKGINKQVKSLNRQVNRQVKGLGRDVSGLGHDFKGLGRKLNHNMGQMGHRRSGGVGIFTGLLLLGLPIVAGALLLGNRKNRESIKQMFKSDVVNEKLTGINEKISETMHQPMIGKLQTQFHSFLEQVGFSKHQSEVGSGGSNGKGKKQEAVSGKQIQTMGEV